MKKDVRIGEKLLLWYGENKRDLPWRKTKDPYRIWVSEVMLQQTQVATVIPYYERFFAQFPTLAVLAQASEDEVLSLWKGLGYYSRARNLWRGAHYVMTELAGKIPADFSSLRKIPGIGEYTAGAIASIAFGLKVPAIDGNVKRIMARVLGCQEPVQSAAAQRLFRRHLQEWQPENAPGDFNQALMDLGAMVCTPKAPKCSSCPLQEECVAYRLNAVLDFPVKRRKNGPLAVTRLTFILRCQGKVYLQKRPTKGLLANLWEFPGVELATAEFKWSGNAEWKELRTLTPEEWLTFYRRAVRDRAFDRQAEIVIRDGFKLSGPLWYTFSHRRWQIYWALIDLDTGEQVLKESEGQYGAEQPSRWVAVEYLDQETLPVAFKEIVVALKNL